MVKPPAKQEMQVQSLGREDPLEEDMATHSSTLAWRIPWTEEPGGLQSTRSQRVRRDLGTNQQKQQVPHISIQTVFVYTYCMLACMFRVNFIYGETSHLEIINHRT